MALTPCLLTMVESLYLPHIVKNDYKREKKEVESIPTKAKIMVFFTYYWLLNEVLTTFLKTFFKMVSMVCLRWF
jgi:hypothetical protein